ncbi:response regulator [Achromobacter deleyi]|uniref:response regulator n=1 Tax=Achromobacter deleyi TaxID=1353891 RepID=UPI00158214E0|nr:response regulator [Achromobacter deleyi]
MKILLVEDEIHKRDELMQCVQEVFGVCPEIVDSVRNSVLTVRTNIYDLIILDMALPTFTAEERNETKGHDQAQGGVEILRALKSAGRTTNIIIVTQYPDFVIAGVKVKLKECARPILEKYGQKVLASILYKYNSKDVLKNITSSLRKIRK